MTPQCHIQLQSNRKYNQLKTVLSPRIPKPWSSWSKITLKSSLVELGVSLGRIKLN